MFSNTYFDNYLTVGTQLGFEEACSDEEISSAESRLGIKLPVSLKEFYSIAGREKRINKLHNRLLSPEKLFIDAGRVVFLEENQSVVFWGIAANEVMVADAPVFQGVNRGESGIEWIPDPEHDSCATFLNVMALWHATNGGAVANTAVGNVEEGIARTILDEQWQLVGEVNAMRAYRQNSRAVCFLQWSIPFLTDGEKSQWRVFVAASSAEELEKLKTSFPASWEEWGV